MWSYTQRDESIHYLCIKGKNKNNQEQDIISADVVLRRPKSIHYLQTQMGKVKLIENICSLE